MIEILMQANKAVIELGHRTNIKGKK